MISYEKKNIKNNEKIIFFARAKINLYLEILHKLKTGYHIIDSLVCFPNIGDELMFKKSKKISLKITGDFADKIPNGENNLIIKAAKLMLLPNEGLDIHLKKNLPVSSGIGGGSSNAAMTLKAICKLYQRELPSKDLIFSIGADTAVCLNQTFQRVQGKGEVISKIDFDKKFYIVLVNMLFPVSTKEIFSLLKLKDDKKNVTNFDLKRNLFSFLKNKNNDLEKVAFYKYPELKYLINDIKSTNGCIVSRMSGSGGTCYGIFKNKKNAQNASIFLKKKYKNSWIRFSIVKSIYS